MKYFKNSLLVGLLGLFLLFDVSAQETRLLRQPSISDSHITFSYGSDIWIADLDGSNVERITSSPAVDSHPHLSPDGQWIAFTSNRAGNENVYVVSRLGGTPTRLTWEPTGGAVRGWAPDGKQILYGSDRGTAPSSYSRLWTVSATGGPSSLLSAQWGYDGAFSPNGKQLIVDKMDRWDVEWRNYRGGQNTPLILLDLKSQKETLLPFDEPTVDIHTTWLGDKI